MLKSPNEGSPAIGRILLVRQENEPILALRVLKDYPENGTFAAKRVRRYGDHRILSPKEAYEALEKISDIGGAPIPHTAQDQADLKELEAPPTAPNPYDAEAPAGSTSPPTIPAESGLEPDDAISPKTPSEESPLPETAEYDPELDSGTSPPPGKADSLSPEENSGLSIEELNELDPHRHMVSAQFGYLTNSIPTSSRHLFMGGGFRYSLTPIRMLFLRKGSIQDSVSLETGLFVYKIVKLLAGTNDAIDTYTVLPVPLTVRYNIALSENFTLFAYGGMLMNFVIGATSGFATAIEALNTFGENRFAPIPSFGGGILFRVGPNWAARADVGYDFIGAGLVLKF
jgi:hypothetical protein